MSTEHEPPSKKKGHSWGRFFFKLATLAALCGVGAGIYGTISAEDLKVECITLSDQELPGAAGLRIAFFADIHNAPEMLEKAKEQIAKAKPHLILFGGDLITANARVSRSRDLILALKALTEIAPCYAILGNHDVEELPQVERILQRAGFPLLHNESTLITCPSGQQIKLIGLGDWLNYDEQPELCMKKKGEEELPVILLSHDPESRHLLKEYDWDLMLSGHTHGGQIGNPWTGEYISFRSGMPAGLYDSYGKTKVYVTRGLGAIFGIRFFCPAELTLIDIQDQRDSVTDEEQKPEETLENK